MPRRWAFGGGAQSSSGISAKLTGLLGTFDVIVDVQKAMAAVTGGGSLLDAFSVPGKFGIQIGSLKIDIPGALQVSGSGIIYNYDPSYDPAKNGGAPQKLLVVNQAQITFPAFGITGQINPSGGQPASSSTRTALPSAKRSSSTSRAAARARTRPRLRAAPAR
jgi:hypothetical protein